MQPSWERRDAGALEREMGVRLEEQARPEE
jgi:hypothetical protein